MMLTIKAKILCLRKRLLKRKMLRMPSLLRKPLLRDMLIVRFLKRLLLANFSSDRDRVRAHQRFNGHDPRLYGDLCHDPMLKELGLRYENIGQPGFTDRYLLAWSIRHLMHESCKTLFSERDQARMFPANMNQDMNSNRYKCAEVGVQSFYFFKK